MATSVLGAPELMFAAYETHDEYGRNRTLIGVFENRHDALNAAEKRGWYGGNGEVEEQYVIPNLQNEEYYLLKEPNSIEVNVDLGKELEKKKLLALSKLTREEMVILGLKNPKE